MNATINTLYGKKVDWVDKQLPGEFGPPAYDESSRSYMWRVFKRGFTWGTKLNFNLIGFMLTSVVMVQYQYVV